MLSLEVSSCGEQSLAWGCRYRDAPEPQLPGHSVTVRPTTEDMKKLYDDAEQTWTPAFVKLIKVGAWLTTLCRSCAVYV